MVRAAIVENGIVKNVVVADEETASQNGWVIGDANIGDTWNGSIFQKPEIVEHVPVEISKRQARQQLIIMGLIGSVQTAIDAIPDATEKALVQSFWDDSSVYERHHPQMIALSSAIGLNEASLDAAFIAASHL